MFFVYCINDLILQVTKEEILSILRKGAKNAFINNPSMESHNICF